MLRLQRPFQCWPRLLRLQPDLCCRLLTCLWRFQTKNVQLLTSKACTVCQPLHIHLLGAL